MLRISYTGITPYNTSYCKGPCPWVFVNPYVVGIGQVHYIVTERALKRAAEVG